MGISRVKKIRIVGHVMHREAVLTFLQELGTVQIQKPLIGEEGCAADVTGGEELEKKISSLDQMVLYLDSYDKKGFFDMGRSMLELEAGNFKEIISAGNEGLEKEVRSVQDELSNLLGLEKEILNKLETIRPWLGMNENLDELKSTQAVDLAAMAAPVKNMGLLETALREKYNDRFYIRTVSQDKNKAYFLLAVLKRESDSLKAQDYELSRVDLPVVPKNAVEFKKDLESELLEIKDKRNLIFEKVKKLSAEKVKLMARHDHSLNLKNKIDANKKFFNFTHAFVMDGWVKGADLKKLTGSLKSRFKEVEVVEIKPLEGEDAPIVLLNKKIVTPLEMLTRMYGMPNSRELDPTPLITPFFIIFFGLCVTDAGYGIVLMLLTAVFMLIKDGKIKTKPGPLLSKLLLPFSFLYSMMSQSRSMMKIVFWGGLSTVVAGAITGGWFGDSLSRFPILYPLAFLKKLTIFDPMVNPLIFLAISLVLGFIQVCYGLILKIYIYIKNGLVKDGIFNPFAQLMIVMGLIFLGLTLKTPVLPKFLWPVFAVMAIFGIVSLFLFSLFNIKGSFLIRIILSVYAVYSTITGCILGDIISYSRLLALGMATSGIAMTVNVISEFALGIKIPFIGAALGIVLALIMLIGGHLFNIVLNAFGGFVHSMRLQYVEFFTKFYEGGGKEFKPFAKEYKYINIKD